MTANRYHRHLHLILMLAIFLILLMLPFLKNDEPGRLLLSLLFLVIILGALRVLAARRHIFWLGIILGVGASVGGPLLMFFSTLSPGVSIALRYACWVAYLSFFILVIYVLLSSLFTGYRVTGDKIYAAISGYLLLGIFWALVYALTEEIDPASFGRVMPQWGGSFSDLIYFSFTTLTTLGYGDLVPQTAVAQTFSYLEAVSGQLFVAILIARLVGMNIAQMSHDRHTGENE